MSYNPRRGKSGFACIEQMEPRQFLSASISPAVHTVAPIPSIGAETFTGTAVVKGRTFTVSLILGTETAKGAFRGTIVVDGLSGSGSGSVTSKRALSFRGKITKLAVVLRGTLSSSLTTITGHAAGFEKGGGAAGKLTLTEVP